MAKNKTYTKAEADALPALTLAYIGDAVYEIAVRERLLLGDHHKNGALHKKCTAFVSAHAQSEFVGLFEDILTDDERRVYGRGRNAKLPVGKKNDPINHCRATGFEALFGYLYLTGQDARLDELLNIIFQE